jgi:putative flippase GtrA
MQSAAPASLRAAFMLTSCARPSVCHVTPQRQLLLLVRRFTTREVATFLAVGGTGYVVDVAAFNLLSSVPPISGLHPAVARTLAVAVAMCVTYEGNRRLTWRGRAGAYRRREVVLFVVFNVIGFGFSLGALLVSHDLLGFTSRLADNISANVVGLALGTLFRYLTYRRFVFPPQETTAEIVEVEDARAARDRVWSGLP